MAVPQDFTPTSPEEALAAKGRYGKVRGGNGFYYGQIVAVTDGGKYLQFQRGNPGQFKLRWYACAQVHLHALTASS